MICTLTVRQRQRTTTPQLFLGVFDLLIYTQLVCGAGTQVDTQVRSLNAAVRTIIQQYDECAVSNHRSRRLDQTAVVAVVVPPGHVNSAALSLKKYQYHAEYHCSGLRMLSSTYYIPGTRVYLYSVLCTRRTKWEIGDVQVRGLLLYGGSEQCCVVLIACRNLESSYHHIIGDHRRGDVVNYFRHDVQNVIIT